MSTDTAEAKCKCQHCSREIEFIRNYAGQTTACPFCGLETILYRNVQKEAVPPQKIKVPGYVLWIVVIVVIIGAALEQFMTRIFGPGSFSSFLGTLGVVLLAIIGVALGGVIYFLPSIMANRNKKRNFNAIFALNLLTGWSFIGWVVALVWALTEEK